MQWELLTTLHTFDKAYYTPELHNKGQKLSLLFKNLLSTLCSWRVSLDVTKPACKLAVVTVFSLIPTPQTKQSLRPEDVGSFGGTKPRVPAGCLATQHLCLSALRMKDLSGDTLGLLVSSCKEEHWGRCCFPAQLSAAKVRPQWETGRAVAAIVRKSEGAGWWVWCLRNRAETQDLLESRLMAQNYDLLVGRRTQSLPRLG